MTSLTKSVFLPLPPDASFDLFTGRAGEWWPEDRRHTKDPESAISILATGRFFERSRAGVEVELGRVRVWDPPHRLILDFYVASGPDAPTDVTITFTPEADGTRVAVEHRPTAASEQIWNERAARYAASWDRVLECLRLRAG
jgi:uncharacterized protein YndB with AHSA1/START domain